MANRFYGDPEQFWRICDANRTLRPDDLETAGHAAGDPDRGAVMGDAAFTLLIDGAPADTDLVDAVEQIEIDASLEEANAFRIQFGITKTALGDWSILEADPFAPLRPVSVLLRRGDALPQTLINGYVAEERVDYSDQPGASTLEISGLDVTSLMNVEEKITAWPNLLRQRDRDVDPRALRHPPARRRHTDDARRARRHNDPARQRHPLPAAPGPA